jgi:hypothetical protein
MHPFSDVSPEQNTQFMATVGGYEDRKDHSECVVPTNPPNKDNEGKKWVKNVCEFVVVHFWVISPIQIQNLYISPGEVIGIGNPTYDINRAQTLNAGANGPRAVSSPKSTRKQR